jgi:hypothetical protein
VIAWVLTAAAGVAVLLTNTRYVRNFLAGPYPFGAKELAQVTDVESTPRYFVSVAADKVFDTGVQEITTTTRNGVQEGSRVSAGYYAVLVGDRFLIVKSATKPASRVAGELGSIPGDLSEHLFSGPKGNEARSRSYPFYLEAEGFRTPGYWGIGIGALFLLLVFTYGRRAWNRLRDIQTHPVVRRASQWGDLTTVSVDAEQELTNGVRYRSHGVILTDRFAFQKSFFAFQLLRMQDLLWAYKKITKRSVNFVPVGKDYSAEMVFYGGTLAFAGKEKLVEEVLRFASQRAPWAVLGFTEEIKNIYTKQQAEFCQAVEARRQQFLSKAVS